MKVTTARTIQSSDSSSRSVPHAGVRSIAAIPATMTIARIGSERASTSVLVVVSERDEDLRRPRQHPRHEAPPDPNPGLRIIRGAERLGVGDRSRLGRPLAHRSEPTALRLGGDESFDADRGGRLGEPRVGDDHHVSVVQDRLRRGEVDRVVAAEREVSASSAARRASDSVNSSPSISAQSRSNVSSASAYPRSSMRPARCAAAIAAPASASSATEATRDDASRQASRACAAPGSSSRSLTKPKCRSRRSAALLDHDVAHRALDRNELAPAATPSSSAPGSRRPHESGDRSCARRSSARGARPACRGR